MDISSTSITKAGVAQRFRRRSECELEGDWDCLGKSESSWVRAPLQPGHFFFIFNLFVEKNLIFIQPDPFIHKLQIDFKRKKIAATANISVEFAGISL